MGGWLSRMMAFAGGVEETRILMLGLDAAGKTTLLYKLKLGEVVTTIPTIGFNVDSVEYKHLRFCVWDVGGQKKIRMLWHHYYSGTNGLIFVIDSGDRDRIGEAREELESILSHPDMRDAPLLVMANKQDAPRAMSASEIAEKLSLYSMRDRAWHVQACVATRGDGLFEGLEWLSKALRKR